MSENKQNEMRLLVQKLNEARRAYEQEDSEIMSNLEYDKLYDALVKLEDELGVTLSNSPTVNVGYQVQSSLPKDEHDFPMLSLDKTKEAESLPGWLGQQEGVISWKLDGLTMVLTYEGGGLKKAVTRGNGLIGEVVTENARVFENLPLSIPYKEKLVVRGEAVIPYNVFEKINEKIDDELLKYKNPRNLCSGTVRQLNNEITAQRQVHFYGFSLVEPFIHKLRSEEMEFIKSQGFDIVQYEIANRENVVEKIDRFKSKVKDFELPSDGLVLIINDIEYGKALGVTSKFPRDSIAFKWSDEEAETNLEIIEWSASRTGLINPVAIFQPVELEGTTVSRASVHNLSILEELKLEVGDRISVYKANMIIPQISKNLSKDLKLDWPGIDTIAPQNCPVCGASTYMKTDGVKTLHCPNPLCLAKETKALTHFVSRDAMNIEGLSEATIEKFVSLEMVKELADIFKLSRFKEDIINMEGFGEKSYENLVKAIEKSRKTTVVRFLYSLGIAHIGLANAKNICKVCNHQWDAIVSLSIEQLTAINGIGEIMAKAYNDFFALEQNKSVIDNILKEIEFETVEEKNSEQILQNKNFVITGSLNNYENRKALQKVIEDLGGKVTGSVTAKTNYLINNDSLSNSSKNKTAKELGIQIITEEEFDNMLKNYRY